MNRDVLRPLALAVLAVLAVALVSATVTSITEPGDPGPQQGSQGPEGSSEEGGQPGLLPSLNPEGESLGNDSASGTSAAPLVCFSFLDNPWVQLAAVAALAALLGLVWYQQDWIAAVGVGAILVPTVVLVFFALGCSGLEPAALAGGGGEPVEASDSASGGEGDGPNPVLSAPLWLIIVAGAVVVALAVITVSRSGGVDGLLGGLGRDETEVEDPLPTTDAAAVGRVAGEAADRIETGAATENEVYRAWAAMTEHLDVSRPESSTPAEFADAAVDAGLAREDVEELTGLFETVRYGGASPTAEREQRAIDALRRIEQYADDEALADARGRGERGRPDARDLRDVDDRFDDRDRFGGSDEDDGRGGR